MTTGFKLARIIGVLATAALLSACSAVKLGYNNINEIGYWWLDGYVDFTDSQAPRVREDLARLHRWHRTNELPRFAQLLHNMERLAPGEVTPAQVCGLVTEIGERLNALADQAEPAVVTLALGLEHEQLLHLERKYRNNNADYRKEWIALTPEEQRVKRFKRVLERSEMVYGPLGEAQRAVLRQQIEQSGFDAGRVLAERLRRQQDALQTLRKLAGARVPMSEARTLLRGYLERAQNPPDPAARDHQEALIQEACRSFALTHNATTPAQRESAVRRLAAYQRDLRELATQQ
jgi:hypothetical protein